MSEPNPGDHRASPDGLGAHLFTFAVIADSHMNAEEARSSSPYPCNRLSNARSRHVIAELNRLAPDFTVHLGDLINPVPALPSYATAAEQFRTLYEGLESPLHLVPGNHDVGDKPASWVPAASVNADYVALYERHFGAQFYAFDHKGCHFVVINAQIINSGLECEAAQRAWLETDLADNTGGRIFLLTHYPPFVAEPGEERHYDNIDEPGRSWLLGLLARHRVEALYAGHVHNFFYSRYESTDCHVLPSISFVRHDYSEFFRVEAGKEHGRNDEPKLGYFVVRVHQSGYVNHLVRTHGATLEPGAAPAPPIKRVATRHTREAGPAPIGVDLRHPWAEFTDIPPSGALDEFGRKRARNDYPLMALWEMGIRKLRVPFQDLAEDATRARMGDLRANGHAFTVYSYGVPTPDQIAIVTRHAELVDAWEVVVPWAEAEAVIAPLADARSGAGLTVYLSKLRSSADADTDGSRFHHFINHGFRTRESDAIETFLERGGAREAVDGFVFRVVREGTPWEEIGAVKEIAAALGVGAAAHIRFSSDSPAEDFCDDLANANRVAESVVGALAAGDVDVFLDTFIDLDRGYFVRTGLIDRLCNPRLAGHVFRHLHGALAPFPCGGMAGALHDIEDGRVCILGGEGMSAALVLPDGRITVSALPLAANTPGHGDWIDLATGEITPLACRPAPSGAATLDLDKAVSCSAPVLYLLRT